MTETSIPAPPRVYMAPRIVERSRSAAVEASALQMGYTPLQAKIVAGRLASGQASELRRHVQPRMADLDAPDTLPDIDKAVDRIVRAIRGKEMLTVASDKDCDGVSGGAIVRGALIDMFGHPPELTFNVIGHRLRDGYGISDGVVQRISDHGIRSGALISVDIGSGDEARVADLARLGIDSVITDHHGVDGAGPPSAFACVNPTREDSKFPDPFIAGCHVAWLTMAAVRRELIRVGHLSQEAPHLGEYFQLSALGTTADCVSFARSRNNRLIVQRGLQLANTEPLPAFEAFRQLCNITVPIRSTDLAMVCAPALNAPGRMGDATDGLRFLRATTVERAIELGRVLIECNDHRKVVERELQAQALDAAAAQLGSAAAGLVVWLPNGHTGVAGIVASRLVGAYGRPTICLSPKDGKPGLATGSARSVPGFHVRDALARIAELAPGLLRKWGGHEGAGGLEIETAAIDELTALWGAAVRESRAQIGPQILTDGALPAPPDFHMLAELEALQPFGREYDGPQFAQVVTLRSIRTMGAASQHWRMTLEVAGRQVQAVWFNVPAHGWEPLAGIRLRAVFELGANTYRGDTSLQLLIRHMEPVI